MDTLSIKNRKYLGSKQRLLLFIEKTILSRTGTIDTFIDAFAGTGVVADHFRAFSRKVIANDLLYSNYVICKTFLNSTAEQVRKEKVKRLLVFLNNLTPECRYIYENYGGTYFTKENAAKIDSVRDTLEELYQNHICTRQEFYVLLTSLLFAADKVANTIGQYDAYMKNIGEPAYDRKGKHRVDTNVYKPLKLIMPDFRFDGDNEVFNKDFNTLAREITGDVLYLDPPYNTRQYVDCYHVLENIALWQKPQVYGKTRKFERTALKSAYSRKKDAAGAFKELVEKTTTPHIFLSYNNEGLIPDEEILKVLEARGRVEVFEEDYPIFGNGAARSGKRSIKERIFYCCLS